MTSAPGFWTQRRFVVALSIAFPVVLATGFITLIASAVRYDLAGAIERKHVQDLRAIESGCAAFAADHAGRYPESLAELWLPRANGRTYPGGTQPPLDAWRNEYHYEVTADDRPTVRIWTLGRDGLPGGEGLDADVDNWGLRFELSSR